MLSFRSHGCLVLLPSILFCSRLCPSTAGHSPPLESSDFFCPLLSLFILLPVAPQCHLSYNVLVFQQILLPLSATLFFLWSICCLYSVNVSIPFLFHIVYVLDYVCLSCSSPNDGGTGIGLCLSLLFFA